MESAGDPRVEGLRALEERLGYHFQDASLLDRALTHSSHAHEHAASGAGHNEALEFLGDAVLGFAVADLLHRREPAGIRRREEQAPGVPGLRPQPGRARAGAGLPALLRLGRGEEKTGGRKKANLWANAYEAVIAALYLDGGLPAAFAFVSAEFANELDRDEMPVEDAKSALQERLQARGQPVPDYEVIAEEGPSHRRRFRVECRVGGEAVGVGEGSSKKTAQQEAARAALLRVPIG